MHALKLNLGYILQECLQVINLFLLLPHAAEVLCL